MVAQRAKGSEGMALEEDLVKSVRGFCRIPLPISLPDAFYRGFFPCQSMLNLCSTHWLHLLFRAIGGPE
jgi:hypothetical protein